MTETHLWDHALSASEYQELEDFLESPEVPGAAMGPGELEGFLTAVLLSRRVILPSEWLAWVWDKEEGKVGVVFQGGEQANRIIGLLIRLMNGIADAFAATPPSFTPLFQRDGRGSAQAWAAGFVLGTRFDKGSWEALWAQRPELAAPFLGLARGPTTPQAPRGTTPVTEESLVAALGPALATLNRLQKEQARRDYPKAQPRAAAPQRQAAKTGRNDPCPCQSGKKYKRCCGSHEATRH